MTFFILFALGTALTLLAKAFLPNTISWKEVGLKIIALAIVAAISTAIVYHENILDYEIWNGKVTSKEKQQVSCSHSYDCNCRQSCTGYGKDRTCREVCSTCYDHPFDYDWLVHTSNGEEIEIEREDRQGVEMPPHYAKAIVGEPTASKHKYKNYLLASPDSILLSHVSEELKTKFEKDIPPHPEVFDYYRINQFLPVKINVDSTTWNKELAIINSNLGARKQVNIIVVLTSLPSDFFPVLRAEWKGGKKNDVVVVIGANNDLTPKWVETMAWSVDGGFGTRMRQAVLELSSVQNSNQVLPVIASMVEKHYQRKPMKEFEYLASSIQPSTTQWVLCALVMTIVSLLLSWLFHKHDTFDDEERKYFSRSLRRRF